MADIRKEYLMGHKRFRIKNKNIIAVFPLVAILVAILVFWCLKLVGITVTGDALCELEEHTHVSDCYIEDELVCLIPEHTHSSECFPDTEADIETSYDWKKTFEGVTFTDSASENLILIADTQMGYTESSRNYEYDVYAQKQGYTRYGAWYGTPYGEWNTLFVSFCINYADINNSEPFITSSPEAMCNVWEEKGLYVSAESGEPMRGDVVFFDTNADMRADRTAIAVSVSEDMLIVIEGDVEGAVNRVVCDQRENVMGYGRTSGLYTTQYVQEPVVQEEPVTREEPVTQEPAEDEPVTQAPVTQEPTVSDTSADLSQSPGRVNRYIPNTEKAPVMFRMVRRSSTWQLEPLAEMDDDDHGITYTSHLEDEVVAVSLKTRDGVELNSGDTVYIGESYQISLEFSEVNTGSQWIQFRHNEDGYLTYQLPDGIDCEPFDEWHMISARTESGTVADVGEYFIDDTGLLRVKFYENAQGVNFVEKYSNVDFSIDFNATVASAQSGSSTEIKFSDKIDIDLMVDGNAAMDVTKTHGEYNENDHTMEYTIRVEAINGVINDLTVDDQIWNTHYALRDSIVVTDLKGNVIDPQPMISDHPGGAQGGFRLSGFPDFSAGDGFLIKYKSKVYDEFTSNETVGLWNGVDTNGKNSLGGNVYKWAEDWINVELEKMKKGGKQTTLTDNNGDEIPVILWEVEIRKDNHDLQGTVIIDTLGDGLEYYTDKPIRIRHYDQWGNSLPDAYISWDDVTLNGDTMSFALPDGYSFVIEYYTTYREVGENEVANFNNRVQATINGREEQTGGTANVVGFVPHVIKSAKGNDGEYVYFTIEAEVPGVIKDWGGFSLTDLSAVWGYKENAEGYLYVENLPQDMVITATTKSGQTIDFTPYVEGGPIENTFILVAPAQGDLPHSFNLYFNTATPDATSSKWILSEDASLKITYKIPFDAKTGTEWTGDLSGDLTLEDVLMQGYKLANEAYFNYTDIISTTASTVYDYSKKIDKESAVHETGVIDYKVEFNNTVPGSNGNSGFINSSIDKMWFNDSFDERLEYVPGSLVLTTYSPWGDKPWTCKFIYNGDVDGNVINVSSDQFTLLDHNENVAGWEGYANANTFKDYHSWHSGGGVFEFTYQLKVKDEYIYTTDYAKFELDNTAEVIWDNGGTSGPVDNTSVFYTGLLHKHVAQDGSKLDFQVHINRMALDILDGVDTLTIHDTMTQNLSVYWKTIKLKYEKEPDVWVDFDSPESEYTYTVTYDPPTNSLTFTVPDSLHIIIDYTTLITENGLVSVENSVEVNGKAEIADAIDAFFKVEEHSGGASGSNHRIVLLKQDGLSDMPLSGATFLLYGPKGDPEAVPPPGVSKSVVAGDGTVLKLIGTYTTGADGTNVIETQYLTMGGPYAMVEYAAPEGYELLPDPVYFYFYATDPNGSIQSVTTLIAIENFSGTFIIPETGGMGSFNLTIIGIAVTAFPILYSFFRRKRERRLAR